MRNSENSSIIEVRGLYKSYSDVRVLKDLNFEVRENEFVAITGPSGCGKTTLLNILAGYDGFDSGFYHFRGRDVRKFSHAEREEFIRRETGMVFQDYLLFNDLSIHENIRLAVRYSGRNMNSQQTEHLLKRFGLAGLGRRKPPELSGGQKQRVAIARLVAAGRPVILLDEPTGNLDNDSSEGVMRILSDLHQQGRTLIMVTHDQSLAARCQRVIHLEALND